ncbi:MAG: peptide ABC transporter substrate-binding protein [Candidatus Paceibacterota bacterium]
MKKFYSNIRDLELLKKVKQAIFAFTKTEWNIFLFLLVLLLGSTVAILQNINTSFMVSVPARGGSINEGIIGSARFINPVLASTDADKDMVSLVYSGLMRKDSNGEMVPDLAEYVDIDPNGLTYTFKLKDKIYFHDGEIIDTDDIVFTINEIKDPIIKSPKKANWDGVTVNKIDDRTIEFKLAQPYASFLENASVGILPMHLWDESPVELNTRNENPVGSGPYKIKKINKASSGVVNSYELTSFSKFILGEPYIKNITLKFYNNETELISALNKGQVDQISSISPENALPLKEEGYRIETRVLPRIFGMFFNQNQNQIFTDKNVLKAMDLAINKDRIVNEVLLGYGIAIEDPVLPSMLAYDKLENKKEISHEENIQKATELLGKNNWTKNSEGFLEKKITTNNKTTLTPLEFSISTSNAPELAKTAELIKQDLELIGMKVEIKTFDVGNLNQIVIRPRKYDALLFGQIINNEGDLFAFWHSSQRTDPGLNIAMYTNPKVDKILEDASKTIDENERVKKYAQFGEEIKKDLPAVFIYSPNFIYIVSKDLDGFNLNNIINLEERFKNVYTWSVKKEKVWEIFAK